MIQTEFSRKQLLTLAGIVVLVLGIVVLPPLLQRFYGVDAVKTAFVVIVVYAALNWYLKRRS